MKNHASKVAARTIAFILSILLQVQFGLAYYADTTSGNASVAAAPKIQRTFYGKASFYANKFHGRLMANGKLFSQENMTAACNVLPLGTRIRVTNLKNGKSVRVTTTDRLHTRMHRLVDLSRVAAKRLGYIDDGLARVKIEVLSAKKKKH